MDTQTGLFALLALLWVASLLARLARGVEMIGIELGRLRELAQRGRQ